MGDANDLTILGGWGQPAEGTRVDGPLGRLTVRDDEIVFDAPLLPRVMIRPVRIPMSELFRVKRRPAVTLGRWLSLYEFQCKDLRADGIQFITFRSRARRLDEKLRALGVKIVAG